jgi:hypothetical protein
MAADERTAAVGVSPPPGFAGEELLRLAAEGRFVLDAGRADEVIAGLERTIAEVDDRIRRAVRWHNAQPVPAGLLAARNELPKYLAAIRMARRPDCAGTGAFTG